MWAREGKGCTWCGARMTGWIAYRPRDNLHIQLMCLLHHLLRHKLLICRRIDRSPPRAMNRAQHRSLNALCSPDPVPSEVLLEINPPKPRITTYFAVEGDYGGVIEKGDCADEGEFLLNADDGAPIEGLHGGTCGKVAALENGDDIVDVHLDGLGFVWGYGIELCLYG